MHEEQQKKIFYKLHHVLFLLGFVIALGFSTVNIFSMTSYAADPKKPADSKSKDDESDSGSVSVDKLQTGEVTLTNDDAKKAQLNPITADKAITGTLNGVYTVAAIIAVITIIVSGVSIIIADGDSQKVATSRKAIIYACAGLVIVGSAFIITGIVQGIGS